MTVVIAQPENLPWLGYFDKMRHSDCFVFLDNVQFKRRYFENRNKIRTSNNWIWLTIPVLVKGKFEQKISEVLIDNDRDWRKKHWNSLLHAYSKAPYFKDYADFFEHTYKQDWRFLADFNIACILFIAQQLSLKPEFKRASELNVEGRSTDLLLNICRHLDASIYYSGKFGKDYLDESRFAEYNIGIAYQDFKHPVYNQRFLPFIPGMSAVDLLFNHGPASKDILQNKTPFCDNEH